MRAKNPSNALPAVGGGEGTGAPTASKFNPSRPIDMSLAGALVTPKGSKDTFPPAPELCVFVDPDNGSNANGSVADACFSLSSEGNAVPKSAKSSSGVSWSPNGSKDLFFFFFFAFVFLSLLTFNFLISNHHS